MKMGLNANDAGAARGVAPIPHVIQFGQSHAPILTDTGNTHLRGPSLESLALYLVLSWLRRLLAQDTILFRSMQIHGSNPYLH